MKSPFNKEAGACNRGCGGVCVCGCVCVCVCVCRWGREDERVLLTGIPAGSADSISFTALEKVEDLSTGFHPRPPPPLTQDTHTHTHTHTHPHTHTTTPTPQRHS